MIRYNLYIAPDASTALRIAHRKYVAAVNAIAKSTGETFEADNAELHRAKRTYGYVLLAEDRKRRPRAYKT